MQKKEDVVALFNSCNLSELNTVIGTFLPYAEQDGTSIVFSTSLKEINKHYLRITFKAKTRKIIEYVCQKQGLIEDLIKSIKECILQPVIKFEKCIVFTETFIDKVYIRYRDQILLRPISNHIGPYVYQEYPAILEFKYDGSSNFVIDSERKNRKKDEIIRILNLLLNFKTVSDNRFNKPYDFGITYANLVSDIPRSYISDSSESIIQHLDQNELKHHTLIDTLKLYPAGIESTASYYSDSLPFDYSINVPHIWHYTLDLFYEKNEKASKILLSTYWFNKALQNLHTDISYALVAFANSLECLIDKNAEMCPECKQDKFHTTARVKALIIDHLGVLPEKDANIKNITALFTSKLRSEIVHGVDTVNNIGYDRGFDPGLNMINYNIHYYTFLVRLVILNWFWDKELDQELKHIRRMEWESTFISYGFFGPNVNPPTQ